MNLRMYIYITQVISFLSRFITGWKFRWLSKRVHSNCCCSCCYSWGSSSIKRQRQKHERGERQKQEQEQERDKWTFLYFDRGLGPSYLVLANCLGCVSVSACVSAAAAMLSLLVDDEVADNDNHETTQDQQHQQQTQQPRRIAIAACVVYRWDCIGGTLYVCTYSYISMCVYSCVYVLCARRIIFLTHVQQQQQQH